MIRQTSDRIDPKRRNVISHKKQQFADATYKQQEYPHRLNFYDVAPTAEIKLEEFEQWAIDRLRGTYRAMFLLFSAPTLFPSPPLPSLSAPPPALLNVHFPTPTNDRQIQSIMYILSETPTYTPFFTQQQSSLNSNPVPSGTRPPPKPSPT